MSQFSSTVVIPVWNQWEFTKACLDTLRPTLGVHDKVVVVDNGSRDETAQGLKRYPWITVITNEENQGFAIACNQGAAVAKTDIVVFLNNDTLLPSHWLEGLTWAFEDPSVAATGPRSNYVGGPQIVPNATYNPSRLSELREFAHNWRAEHRHEVSPINRLVGFCLAVRRSSFEAIGGFDEEFLIGGAEDDDISIRLIKNGGRLLVCHESFVHHHGHATFEGNNVDLVGIQDRNVALFQEKHADMDALPGTHLKGKAKKEQPLLSACMIIKDEIDNLPRCLSSLNGVVDEVVIYDTGSTDGSIELARAAGATVIEGYWDDDFSRARNAALDACSGKWVMHIDADEAFEGDPIEFRDSLTDTPAFVVHILNKSDDSKTDHTHRACRLFQREMWHWTGRLHEQVTLRNGGPELILVVNQAMRLVHYGYLTEALQIKGKAERNLRIAQLDVDSQNGDPVDKLTNLGRSYAFAKNHTKALELYEEADKLHTDSMVVRRALLRAGAQACMSSERWEEALVWLDKLEVASDLPYTVRYFRGLIYAGQRRWEEAIEALEGLEHVNDEDGNVFPMWVRWVQLACAYEALGDFEKAATAITPAALDNAQEEPIWDFVANNYYKAGWDIGELFEQISPDHLNGIFAQLGNAVPEAADAALERLWENENFHTSILACSIRIAPKLSLQRALEWAGRLWAAGANEHCPLVAIANDPTRPGPDRVRAAAVGFTAFGDVRAREALADAASALSTSDFSLALIELQDLAPELLGDLVLYASTEARRSVAMAKALHNLGADSEGVAVLMHGMEQSPDNTLVSEAAAWLESIGHADEASQLRTR